ncbi:MAG: hypothetical protein K6C40_00055 [Thermoguttaceae bacterium]|nr:hypothetical protein [Thermoguttaceae bacterium]
MKFPSFEKGGKRSGTGKPDPKAEPENFSGGVIRVSKIHSSANILSKSSKKSSRVNRKIFFRLFGGSN